MGPTKQQAVWRQRASLNLRRNSHNSKHFIAVIKDILRCLWGHLGIHFIHLNRACELGWSEPTVEAAHVSPSPPHTLFCLSVVCCIVARAHSAGRLVCMLSLIIASGKTTFLCKTECIADCMCCDNRQTGRRTQTPSPLMQTLAFPLTAEPAEQLPNLAGQNFVWKSHSHWDLWGYGQGGIWILVWYSGPPMYSFAFVDWNWCKYCFLNRLYSPSVNGKTLFTQMDRSDR